MHCLWILPVVYKIPHETILDPRYTQNSVVDFLSSKSDPQSAVEDLQMRIP